MENNNAKMSWENANANLFSKGNEVKVVGNSENIEMVMYFLGSRGIVTKRLGANRYMVEFGELEVPFNSCDLRLDIECHQQVI